MTDDTTHLIWFVFGAVLGAVCQQVFELVLLWIIDILPDFPKLPKWTRTNDPKSVGHDPFKERRDIAEGEAKGSDS